MPVKRRKPKQRQTTEAEMEAWSVMFEGGHDWFGSLEPFGFTRNDSDEEARAAAPEAWKRLGAMFLEEREPRPSDTTPVPAHLVGVVSMHPWALYEFGKPPGASVTWNGTARTPVMP